MLEKKIGNQTVIFKKKPYIIGAAAAGGKKESEGPLNQWFDLTIQDDMYGEKTWEKAESKLLKETMKLAMKKAGKKKDEIDLVLSGDLLNQIMSSSFMARDLQIPFLGVYGACSTMTESLLLGAMLIDGGFAHHIIAGASSHFCTAERQFRMPVEHGNQRPLSAQWTATAAGAMIIADQNKGHLDGTTSDVLQNIQIDCGTIGKVIDAGIKDVNQMGAAMAPAAVDTILNHLSDTGRSFDDYDMVITGDLGYIGSAIAADLLVDAGVDRETVNVVYHDCGTMLYHRKQQDVHGGGSGCGCSASVFSGNIIGRMQRGELQKILLLSTGAMLSTISPFQGESIPGIAHAVALEGCQMKKGV